MVLMELLLILNRRSLLEAIVCVDLVPESWSLLEDPFGTHRASVRESATAGHHCSTHLIFLKDAFKHGCQTVLLGLVVIVSTAGACLAFMSLLLWYLWLCYLHSRCIDVRIV